LTKDLRRLRWITLTRFNKQHGKYSGWTAQIIQHEIDHCNGIVI
jgi:peptide deformylase